MKTLKYTKIKTEKQYDQYCSILEDLLRQENDDLQDEIDLLTLLIETWDAEHLAFQEHDPVEVIIALMEENSLKAKNLVEILELSKGTVSKILNYRKGLSKETIRKLSKYFRVSQEAFNRPYRLVTQDHNPYRNAS